MLFCYFLYISRFSEATPAHIFKYSKSHTLKSQKKEEEEEEEEDEETKNNIHCVFVVVFYLCCVFVCFVSEQHICYLATQLPSYLPSHPATYLATYLAS